MTMVRTDVAAPAIAYPLRSPVADILTSEAAKAQLVPLLPRGITLEQVIVEVFRAASVDPKILTCTRDSIILAVGMAVQTGLLISKTIHLVPLNTKVDGKYEMRLNAWTDYKGDIELVIRSGAARFIDGACVYEGDPVFEFELGTDPWVKHRPEPNAAKRGKILGAYGIAHITQSIKKVVWLPIQDIEFAILAEQDAHEAKVIAESEPKVMLEGADIDGGPAPEYNGRELYKNVEWGVGGKPFKWLVVTAYNGVVCGPFTNIEDAETIVAGQRETLKRRADIDGGAFVKGNFFASESER